MKQLGRLLTVVVLATIPSCTAGPDVAGLTVEELTYDQSVEGESATGAGSSIVDASASGGSLHRNIVVGTTAYASFSTTGTIVSGIVRARRGSGACTPGLLISVDGIGQLIYLSSGSTWSDYPFSVSVPAGSHTLGLYYRTGANGCALDVDVVTFSVYEPPPPPPTNTVTLEAETAIGAGTNINEAAASAGAYRSFTASYTSANIAFTTTGSLASATVRVRGGACSPLAQLYIDGVAFFGPQPITSSTWTDIPVGGSLAAGSHSLQLYARTASVGCPLHFDVVTLVTNVPPPPPVTTVVEAELASGSGTIETDAAASNGQARFFTASYISATSSIITTGVLEGVSVRVRGGSCNPMGSIRIDGVTYWTAAVPQTDWTTRGVRAPALPAGPHTIEFYSRWASAGCAIHFDQVTLLTQAP